MIPFSLKKLSAAVLSALLCSGVYAAGLGKMTVLSSLGQPLRAEIELTSVSKDEVGSIVPRLASSDAFRQANIDFNPILYSLRFAVDTRGGRQFIRVSSTQPINEPFVDLLLELGGGGSRLMREYTLLLDPVDLKMGQSAQISPTPVPSKSGTGSTAPQTKSVPQPEVSEKPVAEAKPAKATVSKAGKSPAVSQPAGEAAGTDGYQVKKGDTLAKIASQVKPEGISLDQMLVALYRSNSSAFIGNNMNRLRAGQILKVPDAATAESISNKEAHGVVVAQAADFNAYRNKLAGQVATAEPQKAPEAKQSAAGKITAKVEEKPTAANESKDKLKLSKAGAASASAEKPGAGIAAGTEDRIAKDKALADANARVKELERNLGDLQKLLEVKNKALEEQQKQADLVKKAAAGKPAASAPAASAPAAPVPAVAAPAASVPAKPAVAAPAASVPAASAPAASAPAASAPVAASAPASASASAAATAPAASAAASVPTAVPAASGEASASAVASAPAVAVAPPAPPKPAVKPAAKVTPPPPPEPSFIEENGALLGGLGAALLAVLGGLFVYNKKRREKKTKQFDESILGEDSSLTANSLFGSTGGQSVDTSNSVFNSSFTPSASQLDTNEVDPVAEADVYIAYGRDAQAEEILKEALRTQPERNAVRLKLLEIYANRKDLRAFEAQATELYSMTKGEGEDWAQAADMGAGLDPNNPLYSGGKSVAADAGKSAELTAPTQPMDEGLDALLNTTQEPEATDTLGGDAAYFANTAAAPIEAPVVPELPVEPAPVPEPVAAAPKANSLDFDLAGLDLKPSVPAPAPAPKAEAPADLDIGMLDFGLDTKQPDVNETTLQNGIDPGTAMSVDVGKDDLAFMSAGLPDLGTAVQMPEAPAEKPVEPMNFDLGGISLDLNPPVAAPAESAAADFVASVQEPFDLGAAMPDLALGDGEAPSADSEMATKLDLAIAYQEIGDKDGARELLDEVIKGGTAEQSEKAKSLMVSLA